MSYVRHLQCVLCGTTFPATAEATTCPHCGPLGALDVVFAHERIAKDWDRDAIWREAGCMGMWRFMPLLPIEPEGPIGPLTPGGTPLVPASRLAEAIGVHRLWLKDEGRNPTASVKDRATAVAVAKALASHAKVIATASNGNAAASLAGMAAASGLKAVVFIPRGASDAKVGQLSIYGATVFLVDGTGPDTVRLASEAIKQYGWYNRLSGINPYLNEGSKTLGLEIALDLGWNVPDWVVVPVGNGCIAAGVAKAFDDLYQLGWIERTPRILGVQAKGAPAVYQYFRDGDYQPGSAVTLADSIAVSKPLGAIKAVNRVKALGGTFVLVTDQEIKAAMHMLGHLAGIFAEPAAASSVAGLARAVKENVIGKNDSVAAVISSSGLRDLCQLVKEAGAPLHTSPGLDALQQILPTDLC